VGAYTAAAVASIAFGEPVAVLDGNVERVLARYLAFGGDPRAAEGKGCLLAVAERLVDRNRPGDSNQALMELGATLCTPRRPQCLLCPLRPGCAGSAAPEDFPQPRRRRAVERHRLLAAVVEREGAVLLFRRPAESTLLGGAWELPWIPAEEVDGEAADAAFARRYGGSWKLGERCGSVRHGITHRDLAIEVWAASIDGGGWTQEGVAAGWFGPEQRAGLFLSSAVEKILAQRVPASPAAPARRSRSRRR
jgi:A/G-specific adenine glycosylase